jgi:hypothetical protein
MLVREFIRNFIQVNGKKLSLTARLSSPLPCSFLPWFFSYCPTGTIEDFVLTGNGGDDRADAWTPIWVLARGPVVQRSNPARLTR